MPKAEAGLARWEDALLSAERAYAAAPWSPRVNGILAAALLKTGNRERAEQLVGAMLGSPLPHYTSVGMVFYCLLLGRIDEAAQWYQKSIEQRDIWVFMQSSAWLTRELRASSHWPHLARLMNLG